MSQKTREIFRENESIAWKDQERILSFLEERDVAKTCDEKLRGRGFKRNCLTFSPQEVNCCNNIMRRNKPGTRQADLWAWDIEDVSTMQGPLAVQEYIQELIRNDPSNISRICEPPNDVDINVWQYEHLRQFILELNLLATQLKGICTSHTCPKMKAAEDWLYLCAAHKNAQECSAIDYMIHNLDQSTTILQNIKNYNSRVSIPQSAVKNLAYIVRRLYRLFAHTYFNHREIFQDFEKETYLCSRFTMYSLKFDMMAQKLLTIPRSELNLQGEND